MTSRFPACDDVSAHETGRPRHRDPPGAPAVHIHPNVLRLDSKYRMPIAARLYPHGVLTT